MKNEAEPILKKCVSILVPLTNAVPGLIKGVYYLAKTRYMLDEKDQAIDDAQCVIEMDCSFQEAHILMSQVCKIKFNKSFGFEIINLILKKKDIFKKQ